MATHHASPSEIVDLKTWAHDLPTEHAKTIVKTNEMELARLVFPAGGEFPTHKVSGPIVVHCIYGEIEFVTMGITRILKPGQLVYLMPSPHFSPPYLGNCSCIALPPASMQSYCDDAMWHPA